MSERVTVKQVKEEVDALGSRVDGVEDRVKKLEPTPPKRARPYCINCKWNQRVGKQDYLIQYTAYCLHPNSKTTTEHWCYPIDNWELCQSRNLCGRCKDFEPADGMMIPVEKSKKKRRWRANKYKGTF